MVSRFHFRSAPSKPALTGVGVSPESIVPIPREDCAAPALSSRNIENVIRSLPRLAGGNVYCAVSLAQLQALSRQLSIGGLNLPHNYPAQLVRLPDGATVGLGPEPTSSDKGPTIDVVLPRGLLLKVKICKGKASGPKERQTTY